MSDLQPGDEFAGHRIEAVAGRGGMGVVYRARQLDLDRLVALKLIAPSLSDDEKFRERFIGESRTAAAIDHPNVIPVYYAGEADGRLYIAMRFVDGEDLRARVRREGRLDAPGAAHVISQVAAALDAAHARGLVHRDVKPANVLLGHRDHVYLTDFGLTKRMSAGSGSDPTGATRVGGWVGTLGYVSPEQIRGKRVDARSDVYALGCLLYHALTGSTPYQRDSDEATLWAHLNDPPPPITQTVSSVPSDFGDVVDRALAKDPDERFQSAGDLGRAALAAAGEPVSSAPERVVATGGAAPAPVFADETVASPEHAPTVQVTSALDRRRRRTPPRAAALLGAVLLLAVAGVAVALLAGGGGGGGDRAETTATTTPSTTTAKPDARPKRAGDVDFATGASRPNAIVATKARVWILQATSTSAKLLTTSGTPRIVRRTPSVGGGASAVTAGFDHFWVAKSSTRAVLPYKLSDQLRDGATITVPSGFPVAIAARDGGVWVGSRRDPRRADLPGTITKIDPQTRQVVGTFSASRGMQNMAVGAGSVWVINGDRRSVTRYSTGDGSPSRRIAVGSGAYALAVSGDRVWVSNATDDTVSAIDTKTNRAFAAIKVGAEPQGIAVGGGAVWVANHSGDSLTRIDPERRTVVGTVRKDVPGGPFAVSVRGRAAWVAGLDSGIVVRVTF